MMRPDIFKGIRGAPKGLLLFGPPGNIQFNNKKNKYKKYV